MQELLCSQLDCLAAAAKCINSQVFSRSPPHLTIVTGSYVWQLGSKHSRAACNFYLTAWQLMSMALTGSCQPHALCVRQLRLMVGRQPHLSTVSCVSLTLII